MFDKQDRPYARPDDLRTGDIVTVDGDFACIPPWSTQRVCSDHHGMYILCSEGHHYLSGQIGIDGDRYYTGIYKGEIKP